MITSLIMFSYIGWADFREGEMLRKFNYRKTKIGRNIDWDLQLVYGIGSWPQHTFNPKLRQLSKFNSGALTN